MCPGSAGAQTLMHPATPGLRPQHGLWVGASMTCSRAQHSALEPDAPGNSKAKPPSCSHPQT